jgi:phosphatidylethanolamine/phosphatidyl-N-methylethanolamine N-methyltransferase
MAMNSDTMHFVKAFLRNPVSVGSIVPSAAELAEAMMDGVRLSAGDVVIELGPGTGAFTRYIHRMLPAGAHYLGIERESRFVSLLRTRFPEFVFIQGLAEDAPRYVCEAGLGPVKLIISSLPFASLASAIRGAIITGIDDMMTPGCVFRTFQYVHAYPLPTAVRFRRSMEERFGAHLRSPAVLPNVPPAFVLTWVKDGHGGSGGMFTPTFKPRELPTRR